MANQKLLKKVAPVVLSAAMAMTSMPAAAMAADFSDSDAVSDAVEVEEAQEADADVEEAADDTADVDVIEDSDEANAEEAVPAEDNDFSSEVTEEEFSDQAGDEKTEGEAYVLMNIPYDDFYKAELKNNDVKVDAFTSATKNKSRTSGMMNGNSAYHVDPEGTDVSGVTFPVKVSDIAVLKDQKKVTDSDSVTITVTNRGQTSSNTYTGRDSLIENASYAYYVLPDSETPSYYKELTVNADGSFSFSDVKGAEEKTVETTAELTTETTYGDYQLDINSDTFNSLISTNTDKIYGATVNTTDGTEYGMRHLENIWRGYELAWCTGFTTTVHGGPTSSEHYKSMMGKTIDSVTYYTDKGIITFDINDEKVLTKTGVSADVADIHTTDAEAAVTLNGTLPDGFAAKYTVDGTEVEYKDGKIATGTLAAGTHTLVISDANGEYAPIQASFNVKDAVVPAVYDAANNKLAAAEGATAEQLEAYIKTITSVTVGDKTYAATGRGAKVIVKEDGTLDVSGLELTDGIKFVVSSNAYDDFEFSYVAYQYVYAGLTWEQYWGAEGVYEATNTTSSDARDRHNETDLGGFDAVTRATANHGLHRGSFQTIATIYGVSGKEYQLAGWQDRNTMILTDGTTASFSNGAVNGDTVDHYKVFGLKYVPVKVKSEDFAAFKDAYTVVENGGTLFGGFGEGTLSSYSVTAEVTASTNGLKTAVKNEDGTFSFSARANGTDSGVKDTALKTAEGITATVKPGNGSYGEFLRVDLTGNYGDLGANMQAVKWTYYGNDSTYTNALQTYGTKFAADNWMHKSMGIQLGLTDSVRCQIPQGYDGTGYWTLTVYALGYADYTVNFEATESNIARPAGDADATPLKNIIAEAKALKESDYTPESWAANYESIKNELEECEDMLENIAEQTQYGVDEQITHLREALDSLVKAQFKLNASSGALYTKKTVTLKVTTNLTGTVTWKSSNTKVATVNANGVVTAKAAGTANITATLNGKTATYKLTVKNPSIAAKASASTIYTKGKTAAKITVTKYGVSGTAKFTSSNKKIATVDSKGVVRAKKAGTVKITVQVGSYKKVVTVKVRNASLKLAKTAATIKRGKTTTIKVSAVPTGKVTYTSSNKKVATVTSKGVVKGVKKGTATITVKCNGMTAKFKVTVK